MDFTGLTCVVTGASSGIGRATCLSFARRGAMVIAVARREDRLDSLVEQMGGAPHAAIVCDVSSIDSIRAMGSRVAERTDRVDVLVNNAGRGGPRWVGECTPEEAERVLRVNLLGPIWCIQELLPLMKAAPRSGRTPAIVNVASIAGRVPLPGSALYSASKFALVGFTESLWAEMQELGIQTMVVNPGSVHTEGFPMDVLLNNPALRWVVMSPDRIGEAICAAIENRRTEVRIQWWYGVVYFGSVLMGPLRRRLTRAIWGAVGRR